MEILQTLLLGILQGLTEFLPVSSSGHLVIAQWILNSEFGGGLLFEVTLHVATMVAILLFYRKKVIELAIGTISANPASLRYIGKLMVGTLPAIGVALLAKNWIEQQFELPEIAGLGLLITGTIVWSTRYTNDKGNHYEPSWYGAILIGCAQAIAILPGISRSGSTVAAALALGLSPLAAAQFSFLLGVIAITGAGILLLPELTTISSALFQTLALGALASLLSGLVALWLFVWLLHTQRFYLFAWYAWVLGIATLISVLTTT